MTRASSRPPSPNSAPPQYPIESVDNALRLLLLLGEKPKIRLTDASVYLGVASSTAHRLLAMLLYRGFVIQDPLTKLYEPGPALSRLTATALKQFDVRARIHPVLEKLNADLDETIHFGRLEGQQVHFLDSVESSHPVRVSSRVGRMFPAHATSTGKAMLSTLSLEELRSLYPVDELEAVNARSITSRAVLERDLEKTRRRGYAVSQEESEEGVQSVAVPVLSPSGLRYGINASVPAQRMNAQLAQRLASRLTVAAEEAGGILP